MEFYSPIWLYTISEILSGLSGDLSILRRCGSVGKINFNNSDYSISCISVRISGLIELETFLLLRSVSKNPLFMY